MRDFSGYKEIGRTANTIVYIRESDPDIMLVVPAEGTKESASDARQNAEFMYEYAVRIGRPCGVVVIMANLLAQEPEARRAYAEIDPKNFYGTALIVENALSRALGSFFIGLTRPAVTVRLFDTVENGLEWLKSTRSR